MAVDSETVLALPEGGKFYATVEDANQNLYCIYHFAQHGFISLENDVISVTNECYTVRIMEFKL